MLKDLRLAQTAARGAGAHTALGEHAMRLYAQYAETGQGGSDFSGIIRMLREAHGSRPAKPAPHHED